MKKLFFLLCAVLFLGMAATRAANIVWVSDAPANLGPFFTNNISTFVDHGWVHVLTNAGHNVVRYNPPDPAATALSAADIAALNTNDLIILGRTLGSGTFQHSPQASNWNVSITKPLLTVNAYLARAIRLGWFITPGTTQPDGVPTRLTAVDINDSVTDYIFSEVALTNGNTTAEVYDEAIDRNTSHVLEIPRAGGRVLARAAATIGATNPVVIAEWPAGTIVRTNDALGGYRMYFAAASRELDGASIPGTAGKENLSATGENMFLRAVEIAVRGGSSPISPTSPVGVRRQPVSITVDEGLAATFIAGITGAAPRSVQWERNDGAGFSDITDATSARYTLPRARATDNGAVFRLRASNPFGGVTTDPATLTVIPDLAPPTVVAVRPTESFSQISVRFSEAVDGGATDPANYQLDGGITVSSVLVFNSGTNVILTTSAPMAENTTYNLTIAGIRDTAVASNTVATVSTAFTTFCTQPGFVRREVYSGITGGALSGLLNHPNFINRNPSAVSLLPTPETPDASGDNYGTRLSGYLVPAISGEYIFYLASDDNSQLFLSATTQPTDAILIGQETSFNSRRLWIGDRTGGTRGVTNANISTNYGVITLVAGERYYFQVFHKEGTGGDHLGFTWQAPGDLTPVNGAASAIGSMHVVAVSPCATVTFVQQPQDQSVLENRPVTFAVSLSNSVPNLVAAYQWRKGGVPIAGATNASYSIPLAQNSDEGAYDVVVVVPGGGATSVAATLDVLEDTEPPRIISVGSIDGRTIGVCFDELLNTNELSTTIDPFAYEINDHTDHIVTNVVLRPDGRSVILTIDSPFGNMPLAGQFLITATSITDREGNGEAIVTSASSTVFGNGANIGTPLALGSHYSCDATSMELVGGGLDIWSTADQGYWAYRSITGDFDARVRLDSLSLPATTGPALTAKGGIIVRDTVEANSPTLHLLANPLPPGRNLAEAGRRQTVNGTTTSWGTNQSNLNIPHWLRLVRAGNTFTGYRSSNGVDWIVFANTTQAAAPATMLLGLGVTSHTNSASHYTTGKFSNFTISQPVADLAISAASGPSLVAVGGSVSYNLTVTNLGPDTASAVVLQDTLPSGVTFVSATTSQGACTHAAGIVTCNLGTLAANGSATITITGTATTAGALNNTALVSSGAIDLNTANNSASIATKAVTRARVGSITYSTSAGFGGSFLTENGCTYVIEFKDDLSDNTPWAPLPGGPIVGDGTAKPISDPEVRSKRFYRVRIEAP